MRDNGIDLNRALAFDDLPTSFNDDAEGWLSLLFVDSEFRKGDSSNNIHLLSQAVEGVHQRISCLSVQGAEHLLSPYNDVEHLLTLSYL